jgi:hypothetical protein
VCVCVCVRMHMHVRVCVHLHKGRRGGGGGVVAQGRDKSVGAWGRIPEIVSGGIGDEKCVKNGINLDCVSLELPIRWSRNGCLQAIIHGPMARGGHGPPRVLLVQGKRFATIIYSFGHHTPYVYNDIATY